MTTAVATNEIDPILLAEAKDALSKCKIALMGRPDSVFYTTMCFSLKQIFDTSIRTACTNGRWIKYNPVFFMGLSPEERLFVVLHETLHPAYMHMIRMPAGACPDRWNIACDHVINIQLKKRGYAVPHWCYCDMQFDGMSAEEVYALLPNNPGKPQVMDDLIPFDGDEEATDEIAREITDALIRAQIQSKMSGDKAGTIPGEIEIYLNRLLNPKLPWKKIFAQDLRSFDKNDYTFKKPNRRFFPKHFMPSLHSESLMDIVMAVDVSGSVSKADFLRFVTEVHSLLRMMKPKKMTFVQFDTEIKSVLEINSVMELMQTKFIGGGGTDIHPLLHWANANKPEFLLVFTDGEFEFTDLKTSMKTTWIIHDRPRFKAPFGRVIHYSMKD